MNDSGAGQAYAAYRNVRFFGSLDGLRAFCILLVLWHHSPPFGGLENPARILTRGFTGVDFFFVLSGFLITTLLLREEDRDGRFSLRGFYRRRILRIVPVYFLVVTAVSVWWIGVRGMSQYWDFLPYYYAFLANFLEDDIPLLAPTWSLSVEEQYYLVWPALLLLLPAVVRLRIAVAGVLVALCVLSAAGVLPEFVVAPSTDLARFVLPTTGYAAILIGALLALVLHRPRGFAALWPVLRHRWTPWALLALLLVLWQVLPGRLMGWPNLAMHATMAALLASIVVREDNGLAPVLRLRPLAGLGAISYGVYLYHLIGLHFGVEFAKALGLGGRAGDWATVPVYLVASIAIAAVSFRYYERFFLRLKVARPRPRPAL